ncbi:hypothetical protein BC827DRAFT_1209513 [Russula dissimulans]|nr:hypothetical protein BC827DRAFT_1209513 [Russula dissimulans]
MSLSFNPLSLLILTFRGRNIPVFREQCLLYERIITTAQQKFQSLRGIPANDIVLMAEIPGYPATDQVELSREIWPTIRNDVHKVTIVLESEIQTSTEGIPSGSASTLPISPAPHLQHQPPSYSQSTRTRRKTLADYNIKSGDTLHLVLKLRGDKPVIYLFPPSSLPNVTIELLLTSSWHFSAVYPSPQTTLPFGENQHSQRVTWAVAAEPDGTLVNKSTGTEVSYLYWEALTNFHLITPEGSRATTPVNDIEIFDPSHPSLNPGDSVLLPIGKVTGYLDAALKSLALHTEARTSFITYWLPDFLKHEYVALRFLPQASYEKAAQMRVSPAADVVTRVFMLFRGVTKGDLGLWAQAAARATAEGGATFWTQVVGIDAVRASDRGLFRVLEWGGMEIK